MKEVWNLPLYHLDNIFWNPDRSHVSRDVFDSRLNEILKQDKWIIDGDYSRTYEMRFKSADTIIFLDYPLDICLKGVESRLGKPREDIPFIDYEFDLEFKQWICNWFIDIRPSLLLKLKECEKTKNIVTLNNYKEVEDFLKHLSND